MRDRGDPVAYARHYLTDHFVDSIYPVCDSGNQYSLYLWKQRDEVTEAPDGIKQ